ncbi:hypothetical protein C496_15377 [Natronorubrum tibetense GA33]|uniref:Uncharacterized protein n=1 Tax=Natronorubrum tibetense GA33 TaxID=1114856 RepID=L9VQB8_9EURY|nr:hypothetical protein C496_15377 [Natronorubrum tibetense GA33]
MEDSETVRHLWSRSHPTAGGFGDSSSPIDPSRTSELLGEFEGYQVRVMAAIDALYLRAAQNMMTVLLDSSRKSHADRDRGRSCFSVASTHALLSSRRP